LYDSAENGDRIPIILCKISVYPVGDIQNAIGALKSYKIMRCDIPYLAGFLNDQELREDGYTLKPDTKRP
jgi:hypothetical protein